MNSKVRIHYYVHIKHHYHYYAYIKQHYLMAQHQVKLLSNYD